MKLTTSAQMRELDRIAIEERHIPSVELMERAAEGVAAAVLTLLPDQAAHCRIAALCGAGNNGGDGIAAARLLFFRGMQVRCFLVGTYEKLTPDSLEMTRRLSDCGVELEPFDPENAEQLRYIRQCDAVIDAVFGVGLSREVAEGSVFAAAIDAMNQSRGKIAAADIASGVEADTGRILGRAVRADSTVTFTFPKIGQAVGDGAVCSGEVTVREIGIPADLKEKLAGSVQTVEKPFVQWALPRRRIDGHKGTFGKLLAVGGAIPARRILPPRRRYAPAAGWCLWECQNSSGPWRRPNAFPPCPFHCRKRAGCFRRKPCRRFWKSFPAVMCWPSAPVWAAANGRPGWYGSF